MKKHDKQQLDFYDRGATCSQSKTKILDSLKKPKKLTKYSSKQENEAKEPQFHFFKTQNQKV